MYDAISTITGLCEKEGRAFWEVVCDEDCRERGMTREDSFAEMRAMFRAMEESDRAYDPARKSASGLVGGDGEKLRAYRMGGHALLGDLGMRVTERAIKIAESNACMRRIVASPTAGSCGVLPAVLLSMKEVSGFSEDEIIRALYVAGGIGGVIALRATISGAEGGCQAEIGAACAMAAGAAVYLQGGTPAQIADACAIALKNLMGLACDPVAGLVEVPCVKRNAAGAAVALTSADLSLAGVTSRIPADEVIDAMRAVGRRMDESIRETGTGGIAQTPTGEQIARELQG